MAEDSSWLKSMSFLVGLNLDIVTVAPASLSNMVLTSDPETLKCFNLFEHGQRGHFKAQAVFSSSFCHRSDPPSLANDDRHPSAAVFWAADGISLLYRTWMKSLPFSTSPFSRVRDQKEHGKV